MSASAPGLTLPRPVLRISGESWRILLVWCLVFSGGFVIREPAPYDLVLIAALPLLLISGTGIARALMPLLVLLLLLLAGGVLGLTQVGRWGGVSASDAAMYMAISGYLFASTILFAALIASQHNGNGQLHTIVNAWIWSAVATSLLGALAYFGVIPGADLFTRYGRAAGGFQDPNVFAPYLLMPFTVLVLRLFQDQAAMRLSTILLLAVICAGLFLSFSRGAWAATLLAAAGAFILSVMQEPRPAQRIRLFVILACVVFAGLVFLAIALSFEQVRELFQTRAQLLQNYDAGEDGRFGRILQGLHLIANHPMGLGATSFRTAFFAEEPHNMLVKAFVAYGWLGGISFLILVVTTLVLGFVRLFRPAPHRLILQAAYITFVAHLLLSVVIDMDHWRHYFLIIGVLWGCLAMPSAPHASGQHRDQAQHQ